MKGIESRICLGKTIVRMIDAGANKIVQIYRDFFIIMIPCDPFYIPWFIVI